MTTEISELKREAFRMLRRKKILSAEESKICREALLQYAVDKRDKEILEGLVVCELESNIVLEAQLSSGAPAIAFPFYIINNAKQVVCLEDIQVNFINKNGKNFRYKDDYYLTRTGPVRSKLLIEPNEKVILGPIALHTDLDNEIEGLSCEVSYVDVTHKKRVYALYKTNYGAIWNNIDVKIIPFYTFFEQNDIREYWEDKIEYYEQEDKFKEIELCNFSIEKIKKRHHQKDEECALRGEIHWENVLKDCVGVTIKVVLYDIEERIIGEKSCEAKIARDSGFDVFEILFEETMDEFWSRVNKIQIIKVPIICKNNEKNVDMEILTNIGKHVLLYEALNDVKAIKQNERIENIKKMIRTELKESGVI